jgi:hypothetical protein
VTENDNNQNTLKGHDRGLNPRVVYSKNNKHDLYKSTVAKYRKNIGAVRISKIKDLYCITKFIHKFFGPKLAEIPSKVKCQGKRSNRIKQSNK